MRPPVVSPALPGAHSSTVSRLLHAVTPPPDALLVANIIFVMFPQIASFLRALLRIATNTLVIAAGFYLTAKFSEDDYPYDCESFATPTPPRR